MGGAVGKNLVTLSLFPGQGSNWTVPAIFTKYVVFHTLILFLYYLLWRILTHICTVYSPQFLKYFMYFLNPILTVFFILPPYSWDCLSSSNDVFFMKLSPLSPQNLFCETLPFKFKHYFVKASLFSHTFFIEIVVKQSLSSVCAVHYSAVQYVLKFPPMLRKFSSIIFINYFIKLFISSSDLTLCRCPLYSYPFSSASIHKIINAPCIV